MKTHHEQPRTLREEMAGERDHVGKLHAFRIEPKALQRARSVENGIEASTGAPGCRRPAMHCGMIPRPPTLKGAGLRNDQETGLRFLQGLTAHARKIGPPVSRAIERRRRAQIDFVTQLRENAEGVGTDTVAPSLIDRRTEIEAPRDLFGQGDEFGPLEVPAEITKGAVFQG